MNNLDSMMSGKDNIIANDCIFSGIRGKNVTYHLDIIVQYMKNVDFIQQMNSRWAIME